MMLRRMLLSLMAMLCVTPAFVLAQENWKNSLKTELEGVYRPTVLARGGVTRARTGDVEDEGTVLVVRKPGILADGGRYGMIRQAVVRGGTLTRTVQRASDGQYLLKVGDRVYIEQVFVNDDAIALRLWTADPIERVTRGSTISDRYTVQIKFEFEKGTLSATDLASIQRVVGEFVAPEDQVSAPKTITLGQTPSEVEAILGKPTTIIDLGSRKTYVYPNMRVIFTDDKVSDVQ